MRDIYLKPAIVLAACGFTEYQQSLIRPTPFIKWLPEPVYFFREGDSIQTVVDRIDTYLDFMDAPIIEDEPESPEIPLALISKLRKHARSQDSAIAIDSADTIQGTDVPEIPRGASNVTKQEFTLSPPPKGKRKQREASFLDEAIDLTEEPTPKRARRTPTQPTFANKEDGSDLSSDPLSIRNAHDEEEVIEADSDKYVPRNTPTSFQALAAADANVPPTPKRRGRPPKNGKAKQQRKTYSTHSALKNFKNKNNKQPRQATPAKDDEEESPITYNGRERPADMPHVPCPEGINPRIWYCMSYRCQMDRLDGLKALAEQESEPSDWDTSTDEDDDSDEESDVELLDELSPATVNEELSPATMNQELSPATVVDALSPIIVRSEI